MRSNFSKTSTEEIPCSPSSKVGSFPQKIVEIWSDQNSTTITKGLAHIFHPELIKKTLFNYEQHH